MQQNNRNIFLAQPPNIQSTILGQPLAVQENILKMSATERTSFLARSSNEQSIILGMQPAPQQVFLAQPSAVQSSIFAVPNSATLLRQPSQVQKQILAMPSTQRSDILNSPSSIQGLINTDEIGTTLPITDTVSILPDLVSSISHRKVCPKGRLTRSLRGRGFDDEISHEGNFDNDTSLGKDWEELPSSSEFPFGFMDTPLTTETETDPIAAMNTKITSKSDEEQGPILK